MFSRPLKISIIVWMCPFRSGDNVRLATVVSPTGAVVGEALSEGALPSWCDPFIGIVN